MSDSSRFSVFVNQTVLVSVNVYSDWLAVCLVKSISVSYASVFTAVASVNAFQNIPFVVIDTECHNASILSFPFYRHQYILAAIESIGS